MLLSSPNVLEKVCGSWPMILLLQTHLSFGREFTEAVEMKQVAQQDAEKAKFLFFEILYSFS